MFIFNYFYEGGKTGNDNVSGFTAVHTNSALVGQGDTQHHS